MAALAFRLLRALISRIFNATDYLKKRSISYPNLRVHYSLHPKKTGIPSSLVVSNGVKSAAKRGFGG